MWKICSPSEASQCRTKPSATGVRRSVLTTHDSCGAAEVGWATPGIWMKSSSRSTVDDSTCGGPWTKTATSSTSWCSHGVTAGRPRGSFARYCKDKVGHLVVWSPTSCGATPRRTVMPSVVHSTRQYANNRAEGSHQPTRQRERQMRRFKSAAHAQRFLSVHGLVLNLFRVGRHLLRSAHHRVLRMRAFAEWDAVTCAC